MSRGIGEFVPIQEHVPEWMAIVVALVTQLGDVWFLTLIVGLVYWFARDNREDAVIVVGLTIAGLGAIYGFKHTFALPRPDQPLVRVEHLPGLIRPLYEATGTAGGYGFPSGHAFMTTIVYVRLADFLSVGSRRRRYLGAGVIVTAVCLSRVALGVHYLVDVVAGVGFAALFLFAADGMGVRYPNHQGTAVLGLAVVASGAALVAFPLEADTVALFGAALGAFGGWQLVALGRDIVAAGRPSNAVRPLAIHGGLAAAALFPLYEAAEEFQLFSLPAQGGWIGFAVAAFVTVPVLRHSRRARLLLQSLRFWLTVAGLGGRRLLSRSAWRTIGANCRRYARRARRWTRTRWADATDADRNH